MHIAVHDADATQFPNLALMKLSAWHKSRGDSVEWFSPLFGEYDRVYSSKVFTWTPDDPYLPPDTVRGGTGYGIYTALPDDIEHTCPDYDLYPTAYSMGFLTRGCPRKCNFCFVPRKEGDIRAHADISEFARHRNVVLMDNNVLAHEHGLEQIKKMSQLDVRIDFNQGLDARLIDETVAGLLANVRWQNSIRLACDSRAMMKPLEVAVRNLRNAGYTRDIAVYVLVQDVADAYERVQFLRGLWDKGLGRVDPFAQPFRDIHGTKPPREQRDFARWCNHKAVYRTVSWEEYRGRV